MRVQLKRGQVGHYFDQIHFSKYDEVRVLRALTALHEEELSALGVSVDTATGSVDLDPSRVQH